MTTSKTVQAPEPPIPELFSPLAAPFRLEGTNGEAAVLVHGFTGVPAHFRPMAEHLNQLGFTVNVPLLSGHGTTREHLAGTTSADWERSVRLAVNAVADHRRVHLVGLSLGGLLSIIVAGRTAAATITTINSPLLTHNRSLYLAGIAHRWVPTVDWLDTPAPELDADVEHLSLTYPGFHTVSAAELVKVMRGALGSARRLRRPSLVIQSRVDESVDPRSARLLARALGPPCRLVWLEHSRHNSLLDRERHVVHDLVATHISS